MPIHRAASLLPHFLLSALWVLDATPGVAAAKDPRHVAHVLVIGPGEELVSRFGHLALVIDDRERGTRRVYGWATPPLGDPERRMDHLRGRLSHRLTVVSFPRVLEHYRGEDRDATLYTLDLSQGQAAIIAARIEEQARPGVRDQPYRNWTDNCSTRIRDLIDEVTDGALFRQATARPASRTRRGWTRTSLAGMPLTSLAIDFAIGAEGDRTLDAWEESFMPTALAAALDLARLPPDGRPLVRDSAVVLVRRGPAVGGTTPKARIAAVVLPGALLVLLWLLPLILGGGGPARRVLGAGLLSFGLVAGLCGLVLTLMWLATDHVEAHGNWNLLVAWPTHVWLVVPGFALLVTGRLGSRPVRALEFYLAVHLATVPVAAVMAFVPWGQDNIHFVVALGAAGLALLLGIRRHLRSPTSPGEPRP